MSCTLEHPVSLRYLPSALLEWSSIDLDHNQLVCGQCWGQFDCETVTRLLQPTKENNQFFALATKFLKPETTDIAMRPSDDEELKGQTEYGAMVLDELNRPGVKSYQKPNQKQLCGLVLFDREGDTYTIRLLCSEDAAVRSSILEAVFRRAEKDERINYLVVDKALTALTVTYRRGNLIVSGDPDFPEKVTYYAGAGSGKKRVPGTLDRKRPGRSQDFPVKAIGKKPRRKDFVSPSGLQVGDRVEVQWRGKVGSEQKYIDRYWPAQILAKDARRGTYTVLYEDLTREPAVPRDRIVLRV